MTSKEKRANTTKAEQGYIFYQKSGNGMEVLTQIFEKIKGMKVKVENTTLEERDC